MISKAAIVELSVDPKIRELAERNISDGHFADMNDYFASLVRDDARARAARRIDELVVDAEASGAAMEGTPKNVAALKKRLHAKIDRLGTRSKRTGA